MCAMRLSSRWVSAASLYYEIDFHSKISKLYLRIIIYSISLLRRFFIYYADRLPPLIQTISLVFEISHEI